MRAATLSQLGDAELIRKLHQIVARDRSITAELLAHLAEVDARRLYAPAGYPSMEAYCIHELGFSEDMAHKRIRAARIAREHPAVLEMIADGRLNLSAVLLLGTWLKSGDAAELLAAAANKTRFELEELIAERFPRTEVLALVTPMGGPAVPEAVSQVAPGPPVTHGLPGAAPIAGQPGPAVPALVSQVAPGPPVTHRPPSVAPIAKDRYVLQLAISKDTHEKLEYARALMSHVAGRDLARVFDRALDLLVAKLEKSRCGSAARPRAKRRATLGRRHIPAHVKRAVWQRDGGRCTFTAETGRRCPARHLLQYDHVVPVARGGEATEANLRLRCATHNRLEAERAFGAGFMAEKREAAKRERDGAKERTRRPSTAPAADPERDVTPWLRSLGCKPEHVRLAAEHCGTLPEATSLEERVREALRFMGRRRFPGAFPPQAAVPAG